MRNSVVVRQIICILTSGLKGGSTSPASNILKLISLKKGCDCTSFPPELWQPSLWFGFLVSSCSLRTHNTSCVLLVNHQLYLFVFILLCFILTHLWTEILHLRGKCLSILLCISANPPLHFRCFGMLSSTSKRWPPRCHFKNQAAEAPPVHSQPVELLADHLRSCILVCSSVVVLCLNKSACLWRGECHGKSELWRRLRNSARGHRTTTKKVGKPNRISRNSLKRLFLA